MSRPANRPPVTPFAVGDRITLRKQHPCGGKEWDVHRIGADIGLTCIKCSRRLMMSRSEVERRMRERVPADHVGLPTQGA